MSPNLFISEQVMVSPQNGRIDKVQIYCQNGDISDGLLIFQIFAF